MRELPAPAVLFVLPTYGGGAAAIDAAAITSADLADALGARLGGADMLTPRGSFTPTQVRTSAVRAIAHASPSRTMFARLPQDLRVGVSDLRDWRRARAMRRVRPPADRRYGLILQLHGRFQDAGLRIARAAGVPFVLRLDALEVREEAAWGIRRPGWGGLLEDRGELNLIRRADLVASVSGSLDLQLAQAGIGAGRRMVLPNGVNVSSFAPQEVDADVKRELDPERRFVVGWVGGFRPFHGLDMIPRIAEGLRALVPNATLCLMGTGPEREAVAERTHGLGDAVRILDPVPHDEVPRWLAAFDACLVLARSGDFHYSPMKLYEYLACGRPVVAPDIGQISGTVRDEHDVLLVPPGDPEAIVQALVRLAREPDRAAEIGKRARETAVRETSWDARAGALLTRLGAAGLLPGGLAEGAEEGAA